MDARSEAAHAPARWARPFVKLDAFWTRIETAMVVFLLLAAIVYMSFWVTLNAFHTKGGKLAPYPGAILIFAGVGTALSWALDKQRRPIRVLLPVVLLAVGGLLFAVRGKIDYFANVSRWLADASLIKQMGTPANVSARLFTIWVALLGGSLATGAGRQINIDVVMRFLRPKVRLVVAILSYLAAAFTCFVIAWAFVDYLAVTRFAAETNAKPAEKLSVVAKATQRHFFVFRRQLLLDVRSFNHVVIKGEPFDKWYTGAEWNEEVNTAGWAEYYPAEKLTAEELAAVAKDAPPYPTKPCLSPKEFEDLLAKGGTVHPKWKLLGQCDTNTEAGSTRAPLAAPPEPDDRAPLEADLGLLFPLGFAMIGLRFLLRSILAAGGAVSTDPNAAHGDGPAHDAEPEMAVHEPLVERRVDEEARAHEGQGALPRDDIDRGDMASAESDKLVAAQETIDAMARHSGEPPHLGQSGQSSRPTRNIDELGSGIAPPVNPSMGSEMESFADLDEGTRVAGYEVPEAAKRPTSERPTSPPPIDMPTAQKLEAAARAAQDDEDERTIVGDLSELAKARDMIEAEKARNDLKKKDGK